MAVSDSIRPELEKLGQHSSHYLGGLVGSMLLGFVSFPIFTRVFSVADYGLITLVQKIAVLLVACSKLGLQNSVLRFYDGPRFLTDRQAASRYYSTMFFAAAGGAAAVTLLVVGGVRFAPHWLIDAPLASLLSLGSVLIFLGTVDSMLWSFFRIEERTKLFNFAKVGIRAATIAAVCILLPIGGHVARTYFLGSIAVEIAATVWLSSLLFRRRVLRLANFDLTIYRNALAFGLPLVAYEMAGIVLDSGDRFLVRHYLGGDALGFYSVAYSLSQYVNDLLILPLNLALLPIYMRLWRSEGAEKTTEFLSTGLDLFFMAAIGILALSAVTARDAVLFLASPKYFGADRLMPVLVAGLLLFTTHVFLSAGLIIHKDTRTMAKILMVSATLNMALNCILLPRIGIQGAAIATLLSYLVCAVLIGKFSFRLLPLRLDWGAFARYVTAGAVTCGALYGVNLGSRVVNLFGKAAIAAILYVGVLCVLDARVRALPSFAMQWLRRRPEMARVAVETASIVGE